MDDFDDQDASSHTTSHLSTRMTGRVEVVGRVSGSRRWTVEQKLAILRDAFSSEGSLPTPAILSGIFRQRRLEYRNAKKVFRVTTDYPKPAPKTFAAFGICTCAAAWAIAVCVIPARSLIAETSLARSLV